ncbi:MAG: DUF4396 domain-containing protein [Ardenticatenaceae bacterium]|nr:DUF4396 domain-containing protein [Ardenticatenaceae bacterium]
MAEGKPIPWLKPLGITAAVLMTALLLAGMIAAPWRSTRPPHGYDQPRIHYNTKNSMRFTGADTVAIAARIAKAVYPATDPATTPDTVILYPADNWRAGLQAASLVKPLNGLLLPDSVPADSLSPYSTATFLLMANAAAPAGSSGQALSASDVVTRLTDAGAPPQHAILVDENDPANALLAAPWLAYSGDIVIFDKADAPEGVPIFALGAVTATEGIKRVGGSDASKTAVAFAKYEDSQTGLFGWGMNADSLTGYRAFTIAPAGDYATALLSANLARRGRPGPLFWSQDRQIPQVVNNYFFSQRAAFWVTPSEGPFHHFYILGDTDAISFPAQAQADYTVEIGPYFEKGFAAGPMDMLAAVWLVLGISSALWIAFHETKFLRKQHWTMQLAWPLLAFMIGPFGIPFYWLAYSRPILKRGEMVVWDRPLWLQGMVATASAVGFGGLIMVTAGFVVTLFGMPLIPSRGPLFWLGNPMVLVMVINYVTAVLISWLLYQTPMIAMFYGLSYSKALPKALPLVLISMAAAALAMNPGMWWMMMSKLPMMPTEESILWFGTMFFTVFLAFLSAWPFNYVFIRRQQKAGFM